MKKILILIYLLLISSYTYPEYLPPYTSILTRWGGISSIGHNIQNTTPTFWSIIEIMSPVQFEAVYFYSQLRISTPLAYTKDPISSLLPIINMENFRLGGMIGIGIYLYDERIFTTLKNKMRGYRYIDAGIGWSVVLNLGPVVEGGIFNKNIKNITFPKEANLLVDRFLNIGAEINFRARYNFHKYAAAVIGFDFGYLYALHSGDPFYEGLKKTFISYHTLYYGVTIGFSF